MSQQPAAAVEKYAAIVERMGLPIEGDVVELSKEPVGGLMGWHELAVTVRHIGEGVGYNYPQLAKGLCQHLGFALGRLSELESQLTQANLELEMAHEQRMVWQNLWADASDSLIDPTNPNALLERARIAVARATLEQQGSVLHPAGVWTEGLEANRQQLQQDYFTMKQRAEAAEGRATGLQTELAEQEVEKLRLVEEVEAMKLVDVAHRERNRRILAAATAPPLTFDEAEKLAKAGWTPEKVAQINAEPAATTLVGDETPAPPKDAQKAIKAAQAHMFAALGVRSTPYNEVERNRYEGFLAGYATKAQPYAAASLVVEKGPGA